jgi:membrane protein implicated in regulation of membrane protease activity
MITILSMWWSSELALFAWLVVAFIAAILEVSIPHFGSVFVSAGAIAAAAAAFFGYPVQLQVMVFVVVLVVSLVGLRSRLIGRLGGQGVPSRTDQIIGRHGLVTSDIDPTVGAGRVNVAGEDWAARSSETITSGTRIRVVGADGIVLEVTRA